MVVQTAALIRQYALTKPGAVTAAVIGLAGSILILPGHGIHYNQNKEGTSIISEKPAGNVQSYCNRLIRSLASHLYIAT